MLSALLILILVLRFHRSYPDHSDQPAMTVTQGLSAPLFAVVGATGMQGRSVIDAINASKSPYRVRALMRDTSKAGDLSSLGVEAVAANLDDASSLQKAFEGAKYVFGLTLADYSTWPNTDKVRYDRCKIAAGRYTHEIPYYRSYSKARTKSTPPRQLVSKSLSFQVSIT